MTTLRSLWLLYTALWYYRLHAFRLRHLHHRTRSSIAACPHCGQPIKWILDMWRIIPVDLLSGEWEQPSFRVGAAPMHQCTMARKP